VTSILFRVDTTSNVHQLDINKRIVILKMHGTNIKKMIYFGCKLCPSSETTNPDTIDQKYVDVCITFLVSYALGLMASSEEESSLDSET
jgi:hypothetical protein